MSFRLRAYAFSFTNSFLLVLPIYVAMFVDQGLTPVQISVVLGAWSLTGFIVQAPAGAAADRWPRRYLLAGAQGLLTAGFLVWWIWPSFWGYFAGLVLWGIKTAFTKGVFEALVYDELAAADETGDYIRVIGRARAAASVGTLLAALGAAAISPLGYQAAVLASLAATVVAAGIALSFPRAPRTLDAAPGGYFAQLREGVAAAFRDRSLLATLLFAGALTGLGGALQEFWPVYGREVGLAVGVISIIVGVQYGAEALSNLLAHRVSRLPDPVFFAAFAVAGACLVTAAILVSPWAMILLVAYSAIVRGVDVVFEGRVQAAAPPANRATIGGVKNLFGQLGITGLYAGLGPLAQAFSYPVAFMAAGSAGMAIGGAYLLLSRRRQAPGEAKV